jgi:threonine dehydrogenase-like Zn-dependent dehydrogenase
MGTATIALAKLAGATVIATTRHPGKAARLERWGADIVVDSGRDDAVKAIRAATGGEGVDAAVEYTGASELMRLCIDALRLGGTFCPVGGELREIPLRVVDMVSKELNVHGIRGQRATISAWSRSSWRKGASACRSTRCCRSPRPPKRTPCWNTAKTSWAASCCIPGTMFERWELRRAQKSVAMPLTSQSP